MVMMLSTKTATATVLLLSLCSLVVDISTALRLHSTISIGSTSATFRTTSCGLTNFKFHSPCSTNNFNHNQFDWISKNFDRRNALAPLFMGRAAAVRANTKAKTDAAKAKNNGRYAKKIIMAVKAGGPDPEQNRQLAQIVAEAKAANVPKDIISRNIEKASAATTADFKESLFEFYGHGGVGILVHVLTDNDNRANSDVSLVAKKQLLKPAATNSVAFKFNKMARIDISGGVLDEDTLMEYCLESDVDDYDLRTEIDGCPLNPSEENACVVYVDQKDMAALRDTLREKLDADTFSIQTKLANVPMEGFMQLNDEDFDANMQAIDAFDALDDVDYVEHNIDLTGE